MSHVESPGLPMTLDVVVSIVCHDNAAALDGCLATLPAACDGVSWEACIVENVPASGVRDLVREKYPWASLISNSRQLGFSANHNQVLLPALRDRRARYLLILNDDTLLDLGAVAALVAVADAHLSVGALGPQIRGVDGAEQQSYFPFPTLRGEVALSLSQPRSRRGLQRGWLNGSCVLFRAAALETIGVLDDRFFLFFEDTDISHRLWSAGWCVAVTPRARIVHLEHQTVTQPGLGSTMERQMLRSRYLYMRKHRGRASAALLTLLLRLTYGVRAAKALAVALATCDPQERATARVLLGLVACRPTAPLAHELRAQSPQGLKRRIGAAAC